MTPSDQPIDGRLAALLARSDLAALFSVLFRARPALCLAWSGAIALNAALPAIVAVMVSTILARSLAGGVLLPWLLALGAVFVLMNGAAAFSEALGANLALQATEWAHRRLAEACSQFEGLAHLERPDLALDLAAARDFDLGIFGAPLVVALPRVGARLGALGSGAVMAMLLFALQWWAPLVLAAAWLSTNVFLRPGNLWGERLSDDVKLQQRRVKYDYELMVDAPAAKEVRIFGLANWLGERFRANRLALFEAAWRERRIHVPALSPSVIVVIAANALVFAVLARSTIAGETTLPRAILFIQAAIGAAQLGWEDNFFFRAAARPMPIVLRMAHAMSRFGTLAPGRLLAADVPQRSVRFRDVHFAYAEGSPEVINGIELEIPAGTSLAVVGHNGAGKTTLVKLLTRLYEPTSGRIEIDGTPLSAFDVASWRDRLAVVFQDFIQYHWTLRDNVAPGAADDFVRAALDSAGAANVAELGSVLSASYPGGVEISGGQWQRVALARVIAKIRRGARLVILDEPTANLDIRGEKEIFERLLEETRGCTTILISHRFATVRRADQICVLSNGRIAELGSHEQLMARGGLYAEMFLAQAEPFGGKDAERAR